MITKEMIDRINVLAHKQRQPGLTVEEKNEQAALRRQYIDNIKEQVRGQLESAEASPAHAGNCSCGCHGGHKH
jgi:uncharacterized protein YnzC (UPF0291/DUF896 family)